MSGPAALPAAAYAAALAALPAMTLARLRDLLGRCSPEEAWAVAAGRAAPPTGSLVAHVLRDAGLRDLWRARATEDAVGRTWERCVDLGVEVTHLGGRGHPERVRADPEPAPVLFTLGDRALLDGRRVAVVGTRNATATGRSIAFELGAELAAAGVHVVSGLARGIDVHAHRGTFAALDHHPRCAARRSGEGDGHGRPIAVVACGLDRPYPSEHRAMWARVASEGLLLSEYPPGAPPEAHKFPLRNRLVACLSEIVVVVESRERGGSLITAALAAERGVPVMAVPGSARTRAALGTNELLRDGAAPVLDAGDVLVALSLEHGRAGPLWPDLRPPPRAADERVLRACEDGPATIGQIAEATAASLVDAAMSLARLEQQGWVSQADGWYEAVRSPSR